MSDTSTTDDWEAEVLATWGLDEPPFANLSSDKYFFPSEQHLRALDFMRRVVCSRAYGGVLTGAPGCGKTLLIRSFLAGLDDRILVAHIQRTDVTPREFLLEVLRQFGVELDRDDRTDRRMLLERYLVHQVGSGSLCLLIVENAQSMQPQVLEELRHIVSLETEGQRLMKVLLLGSPQLLHVVDSPRMNGLVATDIPRVSISGLSEDQLAAYVVQRLRAAGARDPDHIFPAAMMPVLHRLTEGVPARVNRLCGEALTVAAVDGAYTVTHQIIFVAAARLGLDVTFSAIIGEDQSDVATQQQEALLLVSMRGGMDRVINLRNQRLLIGRGEGADIEVDSAFVSRYHALIICEPGQDILLDLGSTNGMLVNGKRAPRRVLQHRDLVQIGPVRLTYLKPSQATEPMQDGSETLHFARPDSANAEEHNVFAFGRFDDAG